MSIAHVLVMEQETPAQRTARQRRQAAERARAYRARKRAAGAPPTRAVDAAWSEASCYWLVRQGFDAALDPRQVMTTARLILERQGYGVDASAAALAARLGRIRDEHTWPDHVPSHRPDPERPLRPTRAGAWTTSESVIRRHLQ